MPPKQRFSRELIIQAAVTIIERDGFEGLSHRSIAAELGCSTQPILSNFKTMDEVRAAVRACVDRAFTEEVTRRVEGSEDPMDDMLFAYIRYASEHPNLFLFLIVDSRNVGRAPLLLTQIDAAYYINDLRRSTKLDAEGGRRLYAFCWFLAHGIATTRAIGICPLSMDEIKQQIYMAAHGMTGQLKNLPHTEA